MGSYLIIKSIFNWYLPTSSCSNLFWIVPFTTMLAFGLRPCLFNLISVWYFPLDYCSSIYTSLCSSALLSVASCLSFVSPFVTTPDIYQPALSFSIGILGPFYPLLFGSSHVENDFTVACYFAGLTNLAFTIYQLGKSISWSEDQVYLPSPSFSPPDSLLLTTSPSNMFLLTHTIRLSLWFCRVYGFFGPLLYELYVRQRLSYNFSSHYLTVIYQFLLRPPKKPPDAFDSLSRSYASCAGWNSPSKIPFRTYRTELSFDRHPHITHLDDSTIDAFISSVDMLNLHFLLEPASSGLSPSHLPQSDKNCWDSPAPASFRARYLTINDSAIDAFTASFDPRNIHRLVYNFDISSTTKVTSSPQQASLPPSLTHDIASFESSGHLRSWSQYLSTLDLPCSALYHSAFVPVQQSAFVGVAHEDEMPIVIDTGASRSLSPLRSDFLTFTSVDSKISGVGAQASIQGVGMVKWTVTDQNGASHTIETMAYYVPAASIRLYSPQFHFRENLCGRLSLDNTGVTLSLPSAKSPLKVLSFPFQASSNLPIMLPSSHPSLLSGFFANHFGDRRMFPALDKTPLGSFDPVFENIDVDFAPSELHAFLLDKSNSNLSSAQKELLLIHWKSGHVDMRRLQTMMHPTKALDSSDSRHNLCPPVVFKTKFAKTHLCEPPKCLACILAKMDKVSSGVSKVSARDDKFMALSKGKLAPGDEVSVDQYVVSEKGRLLRSFGREPALSQLSGGGTIYVDHATGRVFIFHQVSLRAGETLTGKRKFERMMHQAGHRVKKYHGDNGIFASAAFRQDCLLKDQDLDFSGVGAQHQNGRAERAIRTITSLSRAMMIHAALHWFDSHDLSLWPMAMDHAVDIWNTLPSSDGLSAEEKLTCQKVSSFDALRQLHVWGAPTYVLEPKLQDGKKVPKFDPRSRQGKFLGYSQDHASSVALILNRTTGKISPQFHCLFDDFFQTVRGVEDPADIDLHAIDWDKFITVVGTDKFFDENEPPPPLSDDWHPAPPALAPDVDDFNFDTNSDSQREPPTFAPSTTPPATRRVHIDPEVIVIDDDDSPCQLDTDIPSVGSDDDATPPSSDRSLIDIDDARRAAASLPRRSTRVRKPNPRYKRREVVLSEESEVVVPRSSDDNDAPLLSSFFTADQALHFSKRKFSHSYLDSLSDASLDWNTSFASLASSLDDRDSRRFFASMDVLQDPFDLCLDGFPTFALSAHKSASSADNPRWHEAMKGPNADGFLKASTLEIATLQEMDAWTQVPLTKDMNVLDSTWAFKIKRFPDGLIRKLKARFCVRGDQQIEGVDFFDTFAPVVQWSTVRMLLVLSLTLGLATKQVDYVSAFCQALISEDIFIRLPKGWRKLNALGGLKKSFKDDHVLKLNRSVYGLRQSPKNFFELLRDNLLNVGFRQSKFDPCLFISDQVICVTYVDDCLFFARNESDIDLAIAGIKKSGMDLQVEDSVAGFLGVHIDRYSEKDENGIDVKFIRLLQTGLIDRIITALGLDTNATGVKTPAPTSPLPRDLDGEPFDHTFNYASVVGMCMYLCNNSRPDLAFAVNQCSRHSHRPTMKHAEYLKRVGRYLLATRDKGMIFSPSDSLKMDCYVDADFAGLYGYEDDQDPHCVKSRTGFVIFVGGCPILWSSKLQSEIACSTMEAEYIACSTACRDLLPLMDLVKEVAGAVDLPVNEVTDLHSTIWEDNVGALTLAHLELPRMTPRSKHIATKYHWFRQFVGSKFFVTKIDTLDQIGDLFTKGLGPGQFEKLRKLMIGW